MPNRITHILARAGAAIALSAMCVPLVSAYSADQEDPMQSAAEYHQQAPEDAAHAAVREALSPSASALGHASGLLPEGTKSLLRVSQTLRHGDYMWEAEGVPPGPLEVWVDLRRQLISVFQGGHEIGTAVIVYGAEDKKTPIGTFPIRSKHRDYHSRTYDAPMPYSLFITNDGVALHGSGISPRRATHGCVGLPLEFARLLFEAAEKGDTVQIVRSDARTTSQIGAASTS